VKTSIPASQQMRKRANRITAFACALSLACLSYLNGPARGAEAIAPAKADESGWTKRWDKIENELDKIFRESMAKLHLGNEQKELTFSSSVDVREMPDAYVARIYAPKSDESKLKVTYDNGMLHISMNDKVAGPFKANVPIPGPVQAAKMRVENKDGIVVATLPKQTTGAAALPPVAAGPAEDVDQQTLREMQRMRDRMDQMTRDLFSDVPNAPSIPQEPLFGSTVKLDNEKNDYVVHFYLPDRDLTNVKVDVKNQQLELTASGQTNKETKGKAGSESKTSTDEYAQLITLPGPVAADQIKVDHAAGAVTVTLPKK
jgi:HSP20 family molecular chaperone IbpA